MKPILKRMLGVISKGKLTSVGALLKRHGENDEDDQKHNFLDDKVFEWRPILFTHPGYSRFEHLPSYTDRAIKWKADLHVEHLVLGLEFEQQATRWLLTKQYMMDQDPSNGDPNQLPPPRLSRATRPR
ncbi:hypothetical protein LTR84_004814 [Exophiala bonariae]|uniref:Uncharacterized protein n=1 Tax=Exophiala bonariae TaxID=1690606 RepID=A0AAV9NNG5_9EURO|nr:hypothetical protein LTR84_004814 [Exophiala bonariae]